MPQMFGSADSVLAQFLGTDGYETKGWGVLSAIWKSCQNSRRGRLECLPAAFIRLCAVLVCTALQKQLGAVLMDLSSLPHDLVPLVLDAVSGHDMRSLAVVSSDLSQSGECTLVCRAPPSMTSFAC